MYNYLMPYDGLIPIYDYKEGAAIIQEAASKSTILYKGKKQNRRAYYDVIMSFDIETTKVCNLNFNPKKDPECIHYFNICFCWQCMVERFYIFGRFIRDFFEMLKMAKEKLSGYVICYIHNIAYEFNNLCDLFAEGIAAPEDVFFKSLSTPLYIRYAGAFEFRCSKQLTGKSLAKVGENVGVDKLKGDFDYSLQRNEYTDLTPIEMNYCYRDVLILNLFLEQERTNFCAAYHKKVVHIANLPYTSTGYVRVDVQKYFSNTPYGRYILKHTALTENEYIEISQAMWGGFTHSNFRYIGVEIPSPLHVDIVSAYPGAFLETDGFPYKLTRAVICSNQTFFDNLNDTKRAVIAKITLHNVKLKKGGVPYIPAGKAEYEGEIIENGKLLYADKLTITACDVDLKLIFAAYDYQMIDVHYFYFGFKKPIPYNIIMLIVKYFNAKTTLKGVEGREVEYNYSKAKLNSIYGMSCQALIHAVINMTGLSAREVDTQYESAKVIPYQWAIYITAYTRRLIYSMIQIMQRNNSFIYSDTDSIFFKNDPVALEAIREHNRRQRRCLEELQKLHFDIIPVNPKGEKQYLFTLGFEDSDENGNSEIESFCAIGAKRYYQSRGGGVYDVTFSGLRATKHNKKGNGYNTQRLIDKYGSLHKAFNTIKDGSVELSYVAGVDKLANYNIRANFRGECCGLMYERPCTYTLYPQSIRLTLNHDLKQFLVSEYYDDFE